MAPETSATGLGKSHCVSEPAEIKNAKTLGLCAMQLLADGVID